mmetsp:Transcript_57670/g.126237  ORF Transcript_57670/g.126237 Transcript_57670/m.126237 type:complete len:81 (+) Transcript_57670:84-326(+)
MLRSRLLLVLGLLLLAVASFRPQNASIADALLRRGGRRFANKRFRDARNGEDDEDRRRRRHKVSRRGGGAHRLRSHSRRH